MTTERYTKSMKKERNPKIVTMEKNPKSVTKEINQKSVVMYRHPKSMTTERTLRVFKIEKLFIFIFVGNICYNFCLKGGEEAFCPAPFM